jgi:hypothetical protein
MLLLLLLLQFSFKLTLLLHHLFGTGVVEIRISRRGVRAIGRLRGSAAVETVVDGLHDGHLARLVHGDPAEGKDACAVPEMECDARSHAIVIDESAVEVTGGERVRCFKAGQKAVGRGNGSCIPVDVERVRPAKSEEQYENEAKRTKEQDAAGGGCRGWRPPAAIEACRWRGKLQPQRPA